MRNSTVQIEWLARLVAFAAFCVLLANTALADDDTDARSSFKARLDAAQMVYGHLLEGHRTGQSGGVESIESLARWSARIAALETEQIPAKMDATDLGSALSGQWRQEAEPALRKHIERMQALAKMTAARVDAGVASAAERAAAKYLALEAECLPEKLDELRQVQEERELDVVLPPASEAKPLTFAPKELFVDIAIDGDVSIDGEKLTAQQLEKALAKYGDDNPLARVIIRADRRTQLAEVVKVMNLCTRYAPDYSLTVKSD